MRNFWVSLMVDGPGGRDRRIKAGPQAKDGGFELTIYQRDRGTVREAVVVRGYAREDGTLKLWAERCEVDGKRPRFELVTSR